MKEADYIVDIGPGAGKRGGEIVGQGTWEELKRQKLSVTEAYLAKPQLKRTNFRTGTGEQLTVRHACLHNLKNVDVSFPAGCLVAVAGVSGSGKSTLVFDVLAGAETMQQAGRGAVSGLEIFDQIILIEQAAITRMKRSNVATFSEAFFTKSFLMKYKVIGYICNLRFSIHSFSGPCGPDGGRHETPPGEPDGASH